MPRIIVTSRFLKCGSRKKLSHLVKYIATRPGVVVPKHEPENVTREKIVNYIATRPGAVTVQQHGLFSQTDAPIDLSAVANEIANHPGNVWTHVITLRRDDAQQMGYDTLSAWQELVRRQMPNIAKHMKIDLAHLRWYAAFHDKKKNPHVHIVVYSTDPKEGFLTEQGIEKIRSGFANDIYADELHHLYAHQTSVRDTLKKDSNELMRQLVEELRYTGIEDEELMLLVLLLNRQLKTAKGKRVYGYLKPEVKHTVDAIFARIAQEPHIREMYTLWCEMEQAKHDMYSSAKLQFPEMKDNPVFKSVKNLIVKTVGAINLVLPMIPLTVDTEPDVVEKTMQLPEVVNGFDSMVTISYKEIDEDTSMISNITTIQNDSSQPVLMREGLSDAILLLMLDVSRVLEEKTEKDNKMLRTDRKMQGIIRRKKTSIGLKNNHFPSQI